MNPASGEERRFPMREGEFVVLMASLMALQALGIDVMLPALGLIAGDLGVAAVNDRQLVIGVFLLSSGFFSLFPGPLSDRFGRRAITLVCLAGFSLSCLLSALVTDFMALLVMRALQGLFSAGLMTLPLAIVRDRFSGDRMARTQSMISMVFMAVPMLAPLLGQAIMALFDWRAIFVAMALIPAMVGVWAWFRLPETLHPEFRQPIAPRVIVKNMRMAVIRRDTVGYVLAGALIQGIILGYINSSQQLLGEALGAGAWFPTVFGLMTMGMILANFVNSRIVERFGTRRVSHAAMLVGLAVACVHLSVALSGHETLLRFALLMMCTTSMIALMGANFQAIALQPFAHIAGSAASAMSVIRLVAGALIGVAIGRAYDGTAVPLTSAMVAMGLGILMLVLFSERGRLFRRLNPPKSL